MLASALVVMSIGYDAYPWVPRAVAGECGCQHCPDGTALVVLSPRELKS
jgi:hypothetical protein